MSEEIQKQKELLYLNALKVANNTLAEAESQGYEISSGVLSASASLLKLKLDEVVIQDGADGGVKKLLDSLILDATKKSMSPHYRDAGE
ncbi:MAG: hypothetical protein JXQ67_05170 [Campylobacterales bacterium]|nr:hypothetical protein [Campylobacterales bacterium]